MSGAQWAIEADGHRAVVTEVGGTLRDYSADGVQILDGFDADELSPGSAGQILAPWPNRIRDGRFAHMTNVHDSEALRRQLAPTD